MSEINWQWLIIQKVLEKLLSCIYHILAIFDGPSKKLMRHSQISFKSWLYNMDSESKKNVSNQCNVGLKKLFFWLLELLLNLEQSSLSDNKIILKVPEENMMPHSQTRFKIWMNNVDSNYFFPFQNKCYSSLKKRLKKLNNKFFQVAVSFILKDNFFDLESALYNHL